MYFHTFVNIVLNIIAKNNQIYLLHEMPQMPQRKRFRTR